MDKLEELLQFVQEQEDLYYRLAHEEMYKGNTTGMLAMQSHATAFQKVRYKIEAILEEHAERRCKLENCH